MTRHDQVVLCTFTRTELAAEALQALQRLESRRPGMQPDNVAVIRRNDQGEISFYETREIEEASSTSSLAMVVGWMLGAAGAILGAPLGPDYGVRFGAYAADDATLRHDVGFPDEILRRLGEQLQAGSSALLMLVHASQREHILAELRQLGGELVEISTLPPATLEALQKS